MDKITALLEFLPEDWKAATVIILIVFYFSFRLLKKDIKNIEKVLGEKVGNIEKLLDRDRARFNEKIGHIDKQLSNHITETNKKIDKLSEGQAALEVKIEKGQAALEVKIEKGQAALEVKNAERHAELYKLLSSKIPDKKQ